MNRTFAGVLAAIVLSAPVYAGIEITMKSVAEGDGQSKGGAQPANSVIRMTAAGDKARIDFVEGQSPGLSEDGYMLTRDGGKTFLLVSPKEKTYMKWDAEAMMGMAGAMGNIMKMQVSNTKVEKVLDENGPDILGYPTRHYKFRTSYRMSMSMMGFKNQMDIVNEDETWATTKLDISAVGAWLNKKVKTQNAEMDKLIAMEQAKMNGVPLKTVSIQSTTDNQGKTTVSRSIMEVTKVRNVGDVLADIPADYQEVNLLQPDAGDEQENETAPQSQKRPMPKINIGDIMKKAMQSAE